MQDFLSKIQEVKPENALYVVATPIGNLGDITLRALQILESADFIICEDTRVTAKLLAAYKLKNAKFITYNDHSEEKTRKKIFELLLTKHSLALVSDAGTPLISDPGYKLVNFLREKDQKIIPLPGASSVTSALSASGLASDNFLFLGFLPTSEVQKTKQLKNLPKNFTFIFFESANRVLESLELIAQILGNRRACAARELTKIYEEIVTLPINDLIIFFQKQPDKLRGEFVIIIEKADKNEKEFGEEELLKKIAQALEMGDSVKTISQNLSDIYGINKKDIYKLTLAFNEKQNKKL